MQQVLEFFSGLFDTSLWPPRWHCGQWSDFHGWLYIISDLLIFSAYFTMPVLIVRYIATKTNARFHSIYFLFAAFIFACGFTHLLDALTFWYPMYRFSALIKLITGIISWLTVYQLIKLLPIAFSLKSADELEAEVEQRKIIEEELKVKVHLLNEAQQIAKLGHWEWKLGDNQMLWSDNLYNIYEIENNNEKMSVEKTFEYIHPDDKLNVESIISLSLNDKKFHDYFYRILLPGNKVKILHTKGDILKSPEGNIIKLVGTSQDVTDLKKVEQELLVKSKELEIKNIELQKFAYVASHDLQEPLRKIRTFISRLNSENKNSFTELQLNYINKISNSSMRMQQLIEDILIFSKISAENPKVLFKRYDLKDILLSVINDMEILIEESKTEVIFDNLQILECNHSQLSQLFQNLLSNSIKFQKIGQRPIINISCEIIKGDVLDFPESIKSNYHFSTWAGNRLWEKETFCKITVSDNGIGFDNGYANRIFEAFQRLSKSFEGTGIGLAIVKKIVENHCGTITAHSSLGKGAYFTIILPVSQLNFARNI